MNAYTTRNEAIEFEIVHPIEASPEVNDAAAEYDLDAIADAILDFDTDTQKFVVTVEADEFWQIVAANER